MRVQVRKFSQLLSDALQYISDAYQPLPFQLPTTVPTIRCRTDQHPLRPSHRHCRIATQFRALTSRFAMTIAQRLDEKTEIELGRGVVAAQLGVDAASCVVKAQLIATPAIDFAAAYTRQIFIAWQIARAQMGRTGQRVVELTNDDGLVGIAAHEADQHLGARPRQVQGAKLRATVGACPAAGHTHPGRVTIGTGGAGTVRVDVVPFAHSGETHFDAPLGVAMDRFAGGADDHRALQLGLGHIAAWVPGGNEGDVAAHAGAAPQKAHLARIGPALAGQRCDCVINSPAVASEQAFDAGVVVFWQIVLRGEMRRENDEFAFGKRVLVDGRMVGQYKVLARSAVAHAALDAITLGLEVGAQLGLPRQRVEIVIVIAYVRRFDHVLVQRGGQLGAVFALIDSAFRLGRHEGGATGVTVIPAVAACPGRTQRTYCAKRSDGVPLFGGTVAMEPDRAGAALRQAFGILEQHHGVRRRQSLDMNVAGAAGPKIPGNTAPPEQAAYESPSAFVVLDDLAAHRVGARAERCLHFDTEGRGKRGIGTACLGEHGADDVELALVQENPGVDVQVEDSKGVPHDQLVAGQAAVTFARTGLGDDPADTAQIALVSNDLDLDGQTDQGLQGQLGVEREAINAHFDAVAYCLDTTDPLRHQYVA